MYQKRKIINFSTPFDGTSFYFKIDVDMIIFELETPFELIKDVVQPACLPSKPVNSREKCYSSGWGGIADLFPPPLSDNLKVRCK